MIAGTHLVSDADGVCHDISKPARIDDPRPDLHADSGVWQQPLLIAADALGEDDSLFGTLLGFRSCGAALVQDERGNWRITHGEMPLDDYEHDRTTWLMLRRREIGELLRRLASSPPGAEGKAAW
jgi:hypothetical protein